MNKILYACNMYIIDTYICICILLHMYYVYISIATSYLKT